MGVTLQPGTLLGGTYRIVRLIGTGGMGEVYEATHSRLAGRYAVKVLLADVSNRVDIVRRFQREAEVTSKLRHPNIVQILDFNQTPQGHPYLVMEYLDGVELAEEIRRVGAMPLPRVLDIVGQIVSALIAAHTHKVVHRDLKPQNLFLVRLAGEDREVVKVVDFGISKVREATTKLTQEATIMGTPQYMAPEQALGRLSDIDERTDQFALATITYELLTGREAFRGETVPAILYQIVHEDPDPITSLNPNVSPAVVAVVVKALAKDKQHRFPTVYGFHAELLRAAAEEHMAGTVARPWAPTAHLAPGDYPKPTTLRLATAEMEASTSPAPARARRWWLAAAVGGLVVAGVVGVVVLRPKASSVGPILEPPPRPVASPSGLPGEPTPTSAPKQTALIDVEKGPPGLQVTVDGVLRDLPLTLPRGPQVYRLHFVAAGHEPYEIAVDGMHEHRTLVLGMRKIEPPETGMRPRKGRAAPAARRVPLSARAGGTAPPPDLGLPKADIPSAPLRKPAATPAKTTRGLLLDL
jgi:serine/threonine-protein kinase